MSVTANARIDVAALYDIVLKELINLEHVPGEVISENYLCTRFGISRTPARAILQHLAQAGFIEIVPAKGSIVTPVHLNIVNQMIYMRVAVEKMVLRDFIRISTPADKEMVRFQMAQYAQAAELFIGRKEIAPQEADDLMQKDLAIHQSYFQVTGKLYIWQRLTSPQPDYSRFVRLDILHGSNLETVIQEHQELMDIIDNASYDAIESLLNRHLYGGVTRLTPRITAPEYKGYFVP